MASKVEDPLAGIEAIEKSNKTKVISAVMVIVLVFGIVFLTSPDLPKTFSESVVENVKNMTSKVKQPDEIPVQNLSVPIIANETQTQTVPSEPLPGILLELSKKHTFKGKDIILNYVNSQGTYCMFRVNEVSGLVTESTQRVVNGVRIRVLDASKDPETCRVYLS